MLLIIIIVAFILTILIIECSSLFNCTISKKETVENIYLENSECDDKIDFLEKYTGKLFTTLEYNETVKLNLDNTQIVFFEDFDIFLNNTFKMSKLIVYPLDRESTIDIINYNGDNITIYVY